MRPDIKLRREKHREYVQSKKDVPCADCGCSYPRPVMEFHHLDPEVKDDNFNVGRMKTWSLKRIDEELSTCVVLCANCHRMRHIDDK